MHLLIAPNAFKNSLNADAAAAAIQDGFLRSKLNCTCECFPIGDGGDGTASLIIKKLNGVDVPIYVKDALGRTIQTSFGLIDNGQTAIIEMADAAGIRLLKKEELAPSRASSFGTGQMIKAALDKGVKKIVIGMGGSATVDGAAGILNALGIEFLDNNGAELQNLSEGLIGLASINLSELDKQIFNCEIVVLCDVENKLLGPQGSATIFGPQKGASNDDVNKLEAALGKYAEIALQATGKNMAEVKYGGTAGGAAAGLYAFINARLVNGIDYFLELTGFEKSLEKADIVVTGEGSIDVQTLQGKGPFGVAYRAKQRGVSVIGLAGHIGTERQDELREYFDVLLSIGNGITDIETALKLTADNLARTSQEIGNLLALE